MVQLSVTANRGTWLTLQASFHCLFFHDLLFSFHNDVAASAAVLIFSSSVIIAGDTVAVFIKRESIPCPGDLFTIQGDISTRYYDSGAAGGDTIIAC